MTIDGRQLRGNYEFLAQPGHNDLILRFGDPEHYAQGKASVATVVGVSSTTWSDARERLRTKRNFIDSCEDWRLADTLLTYFMEGVAVVDQSGALSPYKCSTNIPITINKGDRYYAWLTHKLGCTWDGDATTVRKLHWDADTEGAQLVRAGLKLYLAETLAMHYAELKDAEGTTNPIVQIPLSGAQWEFKHPAFGLPIPSPGSNLFYSLARVYVDGTITATLSPRTPEQDPNTVLVTVDASLNVNDLYDFDYTAGGIGADAAILQAGWNMCAADHSNVGNGMIFVSSFDTTYDDEPFMVGGGTP